MQPPISVHQGIRKLFRAIGTGDLSLLESAALPNPDLALLVREKPDAAALERLDDQLDYELQPHVLDRTDTTMFCRAYWRGMLVPVSMVKTPEGWRADLRWWTASAKPQHESVDVARGFMFGLMVADRDLLEQLTVPGAGIDLLLHGTSQPPAGEMGQYEHVASNLPVIELSLEDTYPSSRGTHEPIRAEWIADDRRVLLVQYHGSELPLQAKRGGDGRWRIDPTILVATVARRMQEANA